jgi:hypothetical protein
LECRQKGSSDVGFFQPTRKPLERVRPCPLSMLECF